MLFCLAGSSPIRAVEAEGTTSVDIRYDEEMVLGGLELAVTRLRESAAAAHLDLNAHPALSWEQHPAIVDIAWFVMALGEFSEGNEPVKAALFQLKNDLGFVRLPFWIGYDDRRLEIVKSYSFGTGDGLVAARGIRGHLLFTFVLKAQRKITERSGFKFEDYTGRAYGDL